MLTSGTDTAIGVVQYNSLVLNKIDSYVDAAEIEDWVEWVEL